MRVAVTCHVATREHGLHEPGARHGAGWVISASVMPHGVTSAPVTRATPYVTRAEGEA